MITFKTGLSKKDKDLVKSLVLEISDIYGDFYITKNNLRLFIKDNLNVFMDCLRQGDKIAFDENGLVAVTGYSDNAKRKYVKILTKTPEEAEKYLKVILWNLDCDLYIKVKKNNPLRTVLAKVGFEFAGGRGKEVLLKKGAKPKC